MRIVRVAAGRAQRVARLLGIALGALLVCGGAGAQDKPGPFAGPERKIAYLIESWEGRSADELRGVWGRPSEQGGRASGAFLMYEETIRTRPGISIFGEVRVSTELGSCQATFELDDEDRITRARYRGDPKNCWDSFRRNEPPE